jgi:hypothetical protein
MSRVSNGDIMLAALKILTDFLTVKMRTLFCMFILIYPKGRILQKDKTSVVSKTVISILVDKGYLLVVSKMLAEYIKKS